MDRRTNAMNRRYPIRRLATFSLLAITAPLLSSLLSLACSNSDSDGVNVAIDLEAPTSTKSVGAATWVTDRGFTIQLQKAYLATGSVEILPCVAAMRSPAPRSPLLELFSIKEAHAHTEGSPTLLGIPVVESLLAASGTRIQMGTLAPPPNSYCQVRYTILKADADAVGAPSDGSMLDLSFYVSGTYTSSNGAQGSFVASSSKSRELDLPVDTTMLSTSGTSSATFIIRKNIDTWFNGVDFAKNPPPEKEEIADSVFLQMQTSFSIAKL